MCSQEKKNVSFVEKLISFQKYPFSQYKKKNSFSPELISFKSTGFINSRILGTSVLLQEVYLDFTENEGSVEWKFLSFRAIIILDVRIIWQKRTESYIWSCNLTVIHYCLMSVGHSLTIRNSIAGSNKTMN